MTASPSGIRQEANRSRGKQLAAEAPLVEDPAAVVEEDERSLAGVRQRDRPEEDLVRERREIELPAEREAEVVERLELEQARARPRSPRP